METTNTPAATDAAPILTLEKGEKRDLTKGTGLQILGVGLGWDVASSASNPYDLDVAIACKRNGRYVGLTDMVYFQQRSLFGNAITHSGDNLTGAGDGDDEMMIVNLANIPADVEEMTVLLNIYQAQSRGQNFGKVKNAFCRLYNQQTNAAIGRYDLSEDYSAFNGVIVGKIYRREADWKFEPLGNGANGDLAQICATLNS